jgi:hypothetical protein
MSDSRRITLVVRGAGTQSHTWDTSLNATNRILFVKALSMLSFVLDHRSEDVDRLLIDGAATADEFLDLLSSLPKEFLGDIILMRGNKSFISTVGRAGGRLLYALKDADLHFYLEATGLVSKAAIAA